MSVPSAAEVTRARTARRAVAILLIAAGVLACVMNVMDVSGGNAGEFRLLLTIASLLLGPGWAAAGFLRRAPAAHVWLLTLGVGTAVTLIVGQIMVGLGLWYPSVALFLVTLVSIPFLVRHAVVAQ
ncbi:hypothetical protein [Pseudonocardia phyllosphaerae]|uniref:hypothetical protein n=1 Tax=Pseudonocardia phyllosphaerae TaxID=3390502 RepID=UPI00397E88A4